MKRLVLFVMFGVSAGSAGSRTVPTAYGFIAYDIRYSPAHLAKTALDLYLPKGENFPVLIFIHGGSFVTGDRKDFPYAEIGESFQRRGLACAVLSYRLSSDSVWPAQPRDVAQAIGWLFNTIDQYGGDARQFYVVGHSAGGQLAALVCSDSAYLSAEGVSLGDIAGCVAMGSMMDDGGSLDNLSPSEQQCLFRDDWFFKLFTSREKFVESFPVRHIRAGAPPFLLLLADKEDGPKVPSCQRFAEAAHKVGVEATVELLRNRTHMGTVESMVRPMDNTVERIVQFIRQPHKQSNYN